MSHPAREGILAGADAFRNHAPSRRRVAERMLALAVPIPTRDVVDRAITRGFLVTSRDAVGEHTVPERARRVGDLRPIPRSAATRPRRGSLPVRFEGRAGDRQTVGFPNRPDLHRAGSVHLRRLPVARYWITASLLWATHHSGHDDARLGRLPRDRQGGGRRAASRGATSRKPNRGSALEGNRIGLHRAADRMGDALTSPPRSCERSETVT
jgi:hypothetical protein